MRWLGLSIAFVAGLPALAQSLAVGQLLVANPTLNDPDFAHSVILLVRYNQQSAIGLFLHRPSNVPVSDVYPELKGQRVNFFLGGPLALGVRALLRSPTTPNPSQRLFADVFLINNRPLLIKLIRDKTPASAFRVYAGYVGWSAGQLQDEVRRGLWRVRPASAAAIFDPHPESLWTRQALQ